VKCNDTGGLAELAPEPKTDESAAEPEKKP